MSEDITGNNVDCCGVELEVNDEQGQEGTTTIFVIDDTSGIPEPSILADPQQPLSDHELLLHHQSNGKEIEVKSISSQPPSLEPGRVVMSSMSPMTASAMLKGQGQGHTKSLRFSTQTSSGSLINLNAVNLSSSTIQMISLVNSSSQMNRPSLLRRPRTIGPVNNPLLSHLIIGESSQTVNIPESLPSSNIESADIITNASSQNTSASDLPPVSAFLKKTIPMEEVIIWQEESEPCEIMEVEQSDMSCYLEERNELGSAEVQQIILCDNDNYQISDIYQNYVVFTTPEVISMNAFEEERSSRPRPKKKMKRGGTSRNKLIPIPEGEETYVIEVEKTPKRSKSLVDMKCLEPECDKVVHNVHDLRTHLHTEHGFLFQEEKLDFQSQDEFKRWRTGYEQEHEVRFIYRGGTKKISSDKAVTYLICHRSGIYKPAMTQTTERKRKMKPQGSCKIGTHCTAGIKLVKNLTTTKIYATICHTHYGHDLSNVQHLRVTGVIKELILLKFDEGLSFSEVLQYVHHNPQHLKGLRLVDRRAIRNIYDQWRKLNGKTMSRNIEIAQKLPGSKADPIQDGIEEAVSETVQSESVKEVSSFSLSSEKDKIPEQEVSEEQQSERVRKKAPSRPTRKSVKSDNAVHKSCESSGFLEPPNVESMVTKLLEHGDFHSGPTVLLYKKEGEALPTIGADVSRLQSVSDMCIVIQTPIQRQLLGQFSRVIHLELVQGVALDILVVVVLDEFLMGIPVAWMICNAVSEQLIENFFQILRINCSQINCDYLFGTKKSLLQKMWCSVFTRKPRILYPQEDVFREIKIFLRKHYVEVVSREKVYEILEKMILTPEKGTFDEGLKSLRQTAQNADFLQAFMTQWYECRSRWAFHTRTQIHPAVEDSFLKLRKFIHFKGTKSLDRNIEDILKIGYDKCFQHDKSLFKGDIKVHTLLDKLHNKHTQSAQNCWVIERHGNWSYEVNGEFKVYNLRTICDCRIRCSACDMCLHQLLCSCGDSQFCVHVHAVKSYIDLNPQFVEMKGDEVVESYRCGDILEVWVDDVSGEHHINLKKINLEGGEKEDIAEAVNNSPTLKPIIPITKKTRRTITGGMENPQEAEGDEMLKQKATLESSTPIIISSSPAAEPISSLRRTSTRLQEKIKTEDSSLTMRKTKTRGVKTNQNRSLAHSERQTSSSDELLVLAEDDEVEESNSTKERRVKPTVEWETVRDELLSLINQIDLIEDPILLNEVKKKVTDLSNVVKKF